MQSWTAATAASRAGNTPAVYVAGRAWRLRMPQWQQRQRPLASLSFPSALSEPEAGWNERHMTEEEQLAEKKWQKRWDQVWMYVADHHRLPAEGRLGGWVRAQREAHRCWKAREPCPHDMNWDKEASLETIPGWTWHEDEEASGSGI